MRNSRGGGIGLEPVYATDVTLNVNDGTIAAGSVSGTINGTVSGTPITGGTISDGNLTGGTFSGTVTLTGDNIKTAIEDVDISKAKVGSDATSLTIGGLATNTQKITYAAETGTTVDGVVLKDKGITAAGGNFTVNGTNAETVVKGANGTTNIYGGGINVEGADGNGHVAISYGSVSADVSVVSPTFFVDQNNQFKQNSLKVGNGTDSVTITNGGITATGELKGDSLKVTNNATVGGALTVKGAATFAKETAFAGGIKTDTISEKTDGAGVTVDGVLLKDKGITAAGNVTTTGDIQGKDITATGALKGQTLGIGTNGSEFTVDANGNTAVGGTLDVTGATTLKDTLNVKGATTLDSTLNVKGATTLDSTLNVAGKTTLKDELQVDKTATFGSAADSQTVINGGEIKADGKLTSKSASIGTVGITDTGVVTGITKLTAK